RARSAVDTENRVPWARPQTSFVHRSGDGSEAQVRGDQSQVTRLAIILALLCGTASATTYYVDPAGSNANDGLSPATPWRTLLKVGISSFQPGDSILFKRDGVWNEWLTPPSSGAAGNVIKFDAYGGNPVTSFGSETTIILSVQSLININGVSYIEIQHIKLDWYDGYGVQVQGSSDHIWLANMMADSQVPNATAPIGFYIHPDGT